LRTIAAMSSAARWRRCSLKSSSLVFDCVIVRSPRPPDPARGADVLVLSPRASQRSRLGRRVFVIGFAIPRIYTRRRRT
jgi:hypothetical protein